MNKVKILIASSTEEFSADMLEIGDFVRGLNDCYLDRGLYLTLQKRSGIDNGKRDEYYKTLIDCDLAFFLFCNKTEQDMTEAQNAAMDCNRKNNKPKVITYFKADDTQPQTKAIEHLKKRLGKETDYYYNTYRHIDTLKLGLLMNIKQLDLDGVDVRLEDGKAWQGGEALLSLDHVEMVSGYVELQRLKTERAALESGFYAAKTKYAENPENIALYEAYFDAAKCRNEAIKEIHDIETRLYHMIEGMYEQTSQGRLSKRQVEGYRLMERGLFKEAQVVLDFDGIVSESRHDEVMTDTINKRAQVHVNEQLQLISVNSVLLDWCAVDMCYREATHLEEKHGLPRKATLDYLEFLRNQYRHSEATELGGKLRLYYQFLGADASNDEKSYLCNLLGIIYTDSQRMAEAEGALKDALAIRLARKDGSQAAIQKDIVIVYNNLARLYLMQNRLNEACEAQKSAFALSKKMAATDPDKYEEYLAYSCVNLGAIYNEYEEEQILEESAELHIIAREIFRRLAIVRPDPYEEYLSVCYVNLGTAYTKLKRYNEAGEQFDAALEIQQRQALINPGVYEPRVAECSIAYGDMYLKAKRYQDAQNKYEESLALHKKLSTLTPEVFEPLLALSYNSLGTLFVETERFGEAESALGTALRLYEKYEGSNIALAQSAAEVRGMLENMRELKKPHGEPSQSGGSMELLTPDEREVALLLIEGETQRDIARKLRLSASDVTQRVKSIRDKVIMSDDDPVIAAIVRKYKLSGRETDVFRCLCRNMTNTEIAAERVLSEEAVRVHIHNLIKKLPVDTRNDVSAWVAAYSLKSD